MERLFRIANELDEKKDQIGNLMKKIEILKNHFEFLSIQR